jgi:enediyne biosynthesis protein E5
MSISAPLRRRPPRCFADPRSYQIAVLGLLLVYGSMALGLPIRWANAGALFVGAQLTQYLAARYLAGVAFDPASALISTLSLTLLLRTDSAALAMLAGVIAIGSKFLIRVRGKHVFNPSNFALVATTLASDHAWLSSGQWGSATIGALALACLGFLVLTRARRAETTIAFLVAFAALLAIRALWLQDPLVIPLHQLENGALLIFAFFMISDPKTTPDSRSGRILFGAVVASIAFFIQFVLYEPDGPIFALILSAPVVPLIDYVARGSIYRWERPVRQRPGQIKGAYRCESSPLRSSRS